MFIDTMTDNSLVPVARNWDTAEYDGEQEADPPGNQNASRNKSDDGEALDREKSMVED